MTEGPPALSLIDPGNERSFSQAERPAARPTTRVGCTLEHGSAPATQRHLQESGRFWEARRFVGRGRPPGRKAECQRRKGFFLLLVGHLNKGHWGRLRRVVWKSHAWRLAQADASPVFFQTCAGARGQREGSMTPQSRVLEPPHAKASPGRRWARSRRKRYRCSSPQPKACCRIS